MTRERRARMLGCDVCDLPDGRGKGPRVSGASHYRWNNGRIISSHGYVRIRVGRCHPLADPNGYAYEHLAVWVRNGNQPPESDEVLHHINGDKRDNRIENLRVEKRSAHSIGHHPSLSDASVRMLRELYAAGSEDMPSLAKRFRVPLARVSRFIRGETRLSAGGPITITHAAGRRLDGAEHLAFPDGIRNLSQMEARA